MRGIISSILSLGLMFLLVQVVSAQNVTLDLTPITYPIVLPDSGGSFDYLLTVTNQGGSPITATVWCMATLPNGTSWGPALGPVTQTLMAGQTQSYHRTQNVPPRAPYGYFALHAYVGIYPDTVWAQGGFEFQHQAVNGTEQEWVARYNGPGNYDDRANALAVDGDGNVYVTGYSRGSGTDYDYATIKYNSAGSQQWAARYNGLENYWDEARSLAVDGGGNVYVSGSSYESGSADYTTIKYNWTGVEEWVAHYNGPANDADGAGSLALDEDRNVYVTGSSYGSATSQDYATIKYNSEGVEQWVARYNGLGNLGDVAASLALDAAGNVYVTGWSCGSGTSYDYATIKYNSAGVEQWAARYNGPGNSWDEATCLAVDGDGNVYVTGRSVGSGTFYDYATIKYDTFGNQLWEARYSGEGYALGGYSYDVPTSLELDDSDNIYVSGYSGNESEPDYATVKYDAFGNLVWLARYNGPKNGVDEVSGLAVDESGTVYVTGDSWGSGTHRDYCTIKYSGGNIANWTSVEATVLGAPLPQECRLEENYPNPFNSRTTIGYQLSSNSWVRLRVYDTAGRLVATLVDGWRTAGKHQLTWEAGDFPTGVYFCRMQAAFFETTNKLLLLK